MAEDKKETPETEIEVSPLGEIEQGPSQFDLFMDKNLRWIIAGGVAIVLAIGAFVISKQLKDASARKAGAALVASESADDYRKVISEHSKENASFGAQFMLANSLFEDGLVDEAVSELDKVIKKGEAPYAGIASFKLASIKISQGKLDEANTLYQSVLDDSSTKFLHSASLLGLGDIAWQNGNTEAAKAFYQRQRDDYSVYALRNLINDRIDLVNVDAPTETEPPAPPEPPIPAVPTPQIPGITTPQIPGLPTPSAGIPSAAIPPEIIPSEVSAETGAVLGDIIETIQTDITSEALDTTEPTASEAATVIENVEAPEVSESENVETEESNPPADSQE